MARAPLNISPLAYCFYEVGVRLGQVQKASSQQYPYGDQADPVASVALAALYASFQQLSEHTDLAGTPLDSVVARSGYSERLFPLINYFDGGSLVDSLIGEIWESIPILARRSHGGSDP